jgi:hypothetical protein
MYSNSIFKKANEMLKDDNKNFNFQELPIAYFCDNKKANNMRNELIKNQVRISECEQGALETTFFSDNNLEIINKQLILTIFKKSNNKYKISPQSPQDLIVVMRYVFLEHAKHLPYDITKQIAELNCRVVGEILPNIWTNVRQRIDYLKEINEPRQINTLPVNVNSNNKNLKSISSIFMN